MSKQYAGKNGKIEFFRFVFCMIILLFHVGKYLLDTAVFGKLSMFAHGAIGVEFFFLVSGFLLAKTAKKRSEGTPELGKETWQFILRKYQGIWFYHLAAFIPTFAVYALIHAKKWFDVALYAVESLPNLFLVQLSGIKGIWLNHVEWYLSAMMIGMFLLYPLLLKWYKTVSRVVAPIAALLIIGWLSHETGKLTGTTVWMDVAYKSLFRAVAELCLGVAAFEWCEIIREKNFTKAQRIGLTALEFGCYFAVVIFSFVMFKYAYEVQALFALLIAVTLSFSRVTYGDCFDNPFCYWLGEMSLPIYLSQVMVIDAVGHYGASLPGTWRAVWGIVGTLAVALVLYGLRKVTVYWKNRKDASVAV